MSIIYLDTSALVKRYVQERGSKEVGQLISTADGLGTSVIVFVEMAAAMARAARIGAFPQEEAQAAWKDFESDWPALTRLKVSPQVTEQGAAVAWKYGLRGYDAVQLASALVWRDTLESAITLATLDRELWQAGREAGLEVWPAVIQVK
jgi:predicted nucleic acid-binding protein